MKPAAIFFFSHTELLYIFSEVSLKTLLSTGRNLELVERIINSLVTRLTMKMCPYSSENGITNLSLMTINEIFLHCYVIQNHKPVYMSSFWTLFGSLTIKYYFHFPYILITKWAFCTLSFPKFYLLGSQHSGTDAQFCIQHLVRKLGSEPYIGQRAILSVCQRILVLAERLLFSDPFDDTFANMHECMFIM